jgi:hypothetical protein
MFALSPLAPNLLTVSLAPSRAPESSRKERHATPILQFRIVRDR